jgi:hypothetical protein
LVGPGFSPYPNHASWWARIFRHTQISPVGGEPSAPSTPGVPPVGRLPGSAGARGRGRAIFDAPQPFRHAQIFSPYLNLASWWGRIFRHTQIRPVGQSDQLVHAGDLLGTSAPVGLLTVCSRSFPVWPSPAEAWAPSQSWRSGPLGGKSREIGRILTKSLKLRNGTNRVAHFVWEKNRARTTYIVKGVPTKTFWRL